MAADPPQRSDQPDVPDGVRELRPPRGLEVRQQVELAASHRRGGRTYRAGTTQRASPQPPSERGIRCAGSIRWSRRRRCRAGRRPRRAGCRSPPLTDVRWSGSVRRNWVFGAQLCAPAKRCALHRFSSQACGWPAAGSDAAVVSNSGRRRTLPPAAWWHRRARRGRQRARMGNGGARSAAGVTSRAMSFREERRTRRNHGARP